MVLQVGGSSTSAPGLSEWFRQHASVQAVDTFEEAMAVLRDHPVDLVISDAGHFLPFESFQLSQHAGALHEHLFKGLCIVDRAGKLAWANPTCQGLPQAIREEVLQFCMDSFPAGDDLEGASPSALRPRNRTLESEADSFEVNAAPIVNLKSGVTHIAAVVWSVTRSRRLQEHISVIDQAAQELIRLEPADIAKLDMQQRLDLLERKVIHCTRELLHFDNFTVHILDPKTNKLELVLSEGMPGNVHEIPIYSRQDGNGICGWVAATGRSYICPDVAADARYISGIEGARSSLTVPLKLNNQVIGVFNIESNKLAAFTEDDRRFASSFARHIAMALHILNLLVTERHTATGRLASDVAAEITAPLNDILTEVGALVEDYIGHDEIRQRLNQVSDNAVRIRDALSRFASRKPGLIDRHRSPGTVKHDPVLRGRRILVADDEEVIRETVCDVLRSYGCEIESAGDGAIAMDLIADQEFDLVLSDIKMPARDGYEVFAAAKERNKNCPVILMTGFGYDPNHSIVRARREGLAAVLFKPFKVEQLLGEIRTAIRSVSGT